MAEQWENLYEVQKKDIVKAGTALADAFGKDPVWQAVFKGVSKKQQNLFFQNPVRYCQKFGKVFAPSAELEGIAGWVPDKYADMTMWRAIRCGSAFSVMKMGREGAAFLKDMMPIFAPLEESRRQNMKGRSYLYLIIIGVAPQYQGVGLGRKMLNRLLRESEECSLPIYTETSTEKNIRMYEKLGFKVLEKIIHPVINLPQWSMVKEV